jgi:hypothetical protein
MELALLRTFQHQIKIQCEFVLQAALSVDEAVKNGDGSKVFFGIQNLLNAAANIRKALWGSNERIATNRKSLRDSLETDENSVLFTRTIIRNHNEHFDERIDRWWLESKRRSFLDMIVGPRNSIAGFHEIDRFRWYDPTTADVLFWGDAFNLRELVDEIKRLYPLAVQESRKPQFEIGKK